MTYRVIELLFELESLSYHIDRRGAEKSCLKRVGRVARLVIHASCHAAGSVGVHPDVGVGDVEERLDGVERLLGAVGRERGPVGLAHSVTADGVHDVVDGKIYVVAGYNSIDPVKVLDTVEVLDTKAATPAWATAPKLPAPRGDVTCASAGGKVYAIGGYYDPTATWKATAFANTMYELTPGAAAWAEKAKMPSSRGFPPPASPRPSSRPPASSQSPARSARNRKTHPRRERRKPATLAVR